MNVNQDGSSGHGANLFKLLGVWVGYFWAINWGNVAAFLSCIATLLVIINMLGWLAPLKAFFAKRFAPVLALFQPRVSAPAAPPGVRQAQDE